MVCDFSIKHYSDCLKKAIQLGYTFFRVSDIDFATLSPGDLKIIIRHDVDHDLSLVKNFSREETNLGICATYYVRLHAKKYNLLSYENIKIIERLLEDGHEIGLHYEFGWSYDTQERNLQKLECEILYLREIFGENTFKSISPHEPSRSGDIKISKAFMKKNGLTIHSYDRRLLANFKYISDSSCRWREGCMHNHIGSMKSPLYILTHPVWWYQNTPSECY